MAGIAGRDGGLAGLGLRAGIEGWDWVLGLSAGRDGGLGLKAGRAGRDGGLEWRAGITKHKRVKKAKIKEKTYQKSKGLGFRAGREG